MSTEPRAALLLAATLLAAGCQRPSVTTALGALCRGAAVQKPVRLTADSVRATAGVAARELAGRQFDLALAFRAGEDQPECNGRTGRVAIEGELAAPLAAAASGDRVGLWRVQGDAVAIDFNPGARDNNLTMVLPLSGAPGRWGISTIAGETLSGRVEGR